jgi:ATP-binding cassette subfamily B protein
MVVSVALVIRHHRRRRDWTDARFAMTNELVERMNGYRTRLAQEPRERWHDDEDQALARYLAESEGLDTTLGTLTAIVPRGWLFLGMLGLVPAFVTGTATPTSFAVSLAGVLLARAALNGLAGALTNLSGALIAWRRVGLLFAAAARGGAVPAPLASAPASGADTRALLDAHEIVFRHSDRGMPVLRGASLRIAPGDRLLLEGHSGAGKSTLSSLLAGLRAPESGLLLLDGLDQRSLGTAAWRRRVASAPQFHENHVLQSTFAFNLLMGRRWPAQPEDLVEAETICRELGLGELLARMPAGLMQMVGETGWQLSHGEKSRLYIARALLQGAEVLLLDESFGALDPETLATCLRCVLARAPTMLVIAHP